MEEFGAVLKVFVEKHLISTVLSCVIATVSYLITSREYWVVEKLTGAGFWLLIAGIAFLLIHFISWLNRHVKDWKHSKALMRSYKETMLIREAEELNRVMDYIDGLPQIDRNYLKEFLSTGNKPITVRGLCCYSFESLLSSPFVKKQEVIDEKGHCVKYKLESKFYETVKYSVEKYGTLGHFEEVEW